MKQKLLITAAIIITLTLGACAEPVTDIKDSPPDAVEVPDEVETHDEVELPDEIEPPAQPEPEPEEYPNLKPLELLGYYIDEDDGIFINYPFEVGDEPYRDYYFGTFDPETFREYFFGTWDYWYTLHHTDKAPENVPLIIDDSEKSNAYALLTGRAGRIGENVIVTDFINGGLHTIYWLDKNEPEKLYFVQDLSYFDSGFYAGNIEYNRCLHIDFLTKTNDPINKPENGFLSRLRLYETAKEYDIDWQMLTEINHEAEDGNLFILNDWMFNNRIYLISETSDKLTFKSALLSLYGLIEIDVVYTLERINGEWVRTVEINEEQIEEYIASNYFETRG